MNHLRTPSAATPRRLFLAALLGAVLACTLAPAPVPAQSPKDPLAAKRERIEGQYAQGWLKKPVNKSDIGESIDRVFTWILVLTTVVFVGVQVVLVWFLVRYRQRRNAAEQPEIIYSHGSNMLEVVWTLIPLFILVVLAFASEQIWAEARKEVPEDPLHVRVLGRQFAWDIVYAGADGTLGTDDDIADNNVLTVPVGRPVMFHISSKDVLHSFFLPSFRLKQDAMPGSNVRVWMTAREEGEFEIACAEFCGLAHGEMRGVFNVVSEQEFEAYLAELQAMASGGGEESYE